MLLPLMEALASLVTHTTNRRPTTDPLAASYGTTRELLLLDDAECPQLQGLFA